MSVTVDFIVLTDLDDAVGQRLCDGAEDVDVGGRHDGRADDLVLAAAAGSRPGRLSDPPRQVVEISSRALQDQQDDDSQPVLVK